jgi:hypothetical protein
MNSTSAPQTTDRTALMAVAGTAAAAGEAVAGGAGMADLTGAAPAEIAAFRKEHPGIPVLAGGPEADLTRDPDVAAAAGARLICASPADAARSGLPPGRVLIETSPEGLLAALATGYPVLVSLPGDRPGPAVPENPVAAAPAGGDSPPGAEGHEDALPAALAVAALSDWLGAAIVRTRYPGPVRRALDLTDSVRGVRPPARTVRGLA